LDMAHRHFSLTSENTHPLHWIGLALTLAWPSLLAKASIPH
jgi:hypothetical protein